ncbi:MAG: DUF2785 domain-containing protein [Caldimonas sp.]
MKIDRCMKRAGRAAVFVAAAATVLTASAACPPGGLDRPAFEALRENGWRVDDAARRQALALEIIDCLAEADPRLRDELGFDALSRWMRARLLEPSTLQALRIELQSRLGFAAPDPSAEFRRPFAALALAEVARVDRLNPFLATDQRDALIAAGTGYLTSVRDYRGYEPGVGWRHGVAHGADLMLQLALNPALDRPRLQLLLAAIASQVVPPVPHFYVFGEGERLMAPVFYIAQRDLLDAADWSAFFGGLDFARARAEPPTLDSLASRHDLNQFVLALYASLAENGTPAMKAKLLPAVREALRAIE